MKKIFLMFIAILGIAALSSGCSATWEGVKQDSSQAWGATKEGIHNATE